MKEEKDVKQESGRADYIFVKEVRKERSNCLMKPKSGEAWYEMVDKKGTDDVDGDDADSGVETSQYW